MKRHTDFHSRAQRTANLDRNDKDVGTDTALKLSDAALENSSASLEAPFAENYERKSALLDEVRNSDLWAFTTKQLEGRLRNYKSLYDKELVLKHRTEFKHEVERTRWVLKWREMNPGKLRPASKKDKIQPHPLQSPTVQHDPMKRTKAALNRFADAWLQDANQKIKDKTDA
jgi:hypothetical protein